MVTNKDLPKEERVRAYLGETCVFNQNYEVDGGRICDEPTPWYAWVKGRELGQFSTFQEAIHVADWYARHPNPLISDRRPDYSPDSPHWGQPHEDCCK
jgi:hypothetical protein